MIVIVIERKGMVERRKGSGFAGTGVNGGGTFLPATPEGGSPNNHG